MARLRRPGRTRNRLIGGTLLAALAFTLGGCFANAGEPDAVEAQDGVAPSQVQREDEEGLGTFVKRHLADLLDEVSEPSRGNPAAGYIPDGVSVSPFEVEHAAIANLDTALLDAVQQAALDARADGIEIRVSSGWRSAAYQQSLLDDAIQHYASEEVARRFVATPAESKHVTGEAVDVAPMDAMSWLAQRGSWYGLCQTYANELWHYELMTEPGGVCPPQLRDASAG